MINMLRYGIDGYEFQQSSLFFRILSRTCHLFCMCATHLISEFRDVKYNASSSVMEN
jgi:hypothetical protein